MDFHSFTDWLAVLSFFALVFWGFYGVASILVYAVRRTLEELKTPPVVKRIRKYSRRRFDLRYQGGRDDSV